MSANEAKLQELLDRSAIEEVLIRYVNRNDANDWDGMVQCFTEDGGWAHDPGAGRAKLREGFSRMREMSSTMMPIDRVERCQHAVSNVEIKIDGDTATAFCLARAYLYGPRGDDYVMLVRGITYTDRLVRTAEGWLIKERAHDLVWMFEAPPVEGVQAAAAHATP